MKQFKVNKKSGFLITKLPLVILDHKKRPFYSTEKLKKKIKAFNLPKGEYYLSEGGFKQMSNPVAYSLFKMPKRERFTKPNPKNFKIVFGDNPHKCLIMWDKNTIFFDNKLKGLTIPEIMFILFHEYGHQKYKTEKYCDLYAANMMLKKGFNPSQIGFSSLNNLSENQFERKEFLISNLLSQKHETG